MYSPSDHYFERSNINTSFPNGVQVNVNQQIGYSGKPTEPPKQDYIHVQSTREQATDTHSVAETEKIRERMNYLEHIVPGCNKVIDKSLVLDEIINHVESLQRQVEFLSMKLAAVNSMRPSIVGFPSKDFGIDTSPREQSRGSSPELLHMQIQEEASVNWIEPRSFSSQSMESLPQDKTYQDQGKSFYIDPLYLELDPEEAMKQTNQMLCPEKVYEPGEVSPVEDVEFATTAELHPSFFQSITSLPRQEGEEDTIVLDSSAQKLILKDAPQIQNELFILGVENADTDIHFVNKTREEVTPDTRKNLEKDISSESLAKHFGGPLDVVAKRFGVSRSTFKRICRGHGIKRWQSGKRRIGDNISSQLERKLNAEMAAAPPAAPPSTSSAKWTDELHTIFVELCAVEVIKGNRVGTTLNKEGWGVVHKELVRQKNVKWSIKQFKNHWESMKGDYKLFSKLKFGESGLGWNENTKKIEAPDIWWIQKTEANPKINKFRNKDLSLFMQYYDTLFGDIVATGERARAANTYSAVDLEVGEEFTEVQEDDGKEGSGDSDDNNTGVPTNLFPPSSLKSGRSSGSKRKKSGAECLREGFDGLVAAMSCRSTQTTAATEDQTLNEAVDLLDTMEQVPVGSDFYYFAGRYILDKGNRTLFLKARNNEIRYGQLMYNFRMAGFSGAQ